MITQLTKEWSTKSRPQTWLLVTTSKLATLLASTAIIVACGGKDVGSSSSTGASKSSVAVPSSVASTATSSSVSVSSSSAANPAAGNIALGKQKFQTQCAACHTDQNNGTFGTGGYYFEINNLQFPSSSNYANSVAGLEDFIYDRMPKILELPTTCQTDCAEHIAAYLWSLRSAPASSAGSNSSSAGNQATQYSQFTASVSAGSAHYDQMCISCHGVKGQGGGALTAIKLDIYPTAGALHTYIEAYMPKVGQSTNGPLDCTGQCAADLAAFINSWREPEVAACSLDTPVTYTERSLKLLTSAEYRNSIQDLFPSAAVPSEYLQTLPDIKIGKFPNHFDAVVISGRARQFMTNAEKIADWALENNQFAACDNATTCANAFIDDFAYRAFRRPLSTGPSADENEVAQIKDLFAQAPTPRLGLRWAIITTLTSPNFLYRSEMGIKVSEAIAKGWKIGADAGAGNVDDYIADGSGITVNGANFATKSSGEPATDFGYNMYTNGTSSQQFSFTDPTLLSITVKGNDMDMIWPEMEISVGQTILAIETVDSYDPMTVTYLVKGITGNQNVAIKFDNDAGREPYGSPGNDIDLMIGDVNVAPAKLKDSGTAVDTRTTLEKADPDAYVLDPFEYAAALSYSIIGSTPDAALMAAAKSGDINNPAEVSKQIDRLLAGDAIERNMKEFAETWMRVDHMFEPAFLRNGNNFNLDIRDAMIEELRTTFWNVFDNENVPFSELYSADYIYANKVLADFYGLNFNGGNPNEFVKITTTQRGGLPTMGAFLVNWAHPDESAPILRAVNIREQMLCHHIDPPPQTNIAERDELKKQVDALLADGTMTSREYYRLITTHPQCDSCHLHDINPLGSGLEDFDNTGLPRITQLDLGGKGNTLNIDSTGVLFGPEIFKDNGTAVDFTGAKALSKVLAQTDAVQACLSEKVFRMAVGRPIKPTGRDQLTSERALTSKETNDYACAAEILNTSLQQSNQSPKAMLKTLGTLDLIRFRR